MLDDTGLRLAVEPEMARPKTAARLPASPTVITSARGKLMVAADEGKAIPLGWALDRRGNPTTDPKAGLEGSMPPAGGVTGAIPALMVEKPALRHAAGRNIRLPGYRRHDLAHRVGREGLKVSEVKMQKLGKIASKS